MINLKKGSKVYTSGDYSDDEILDMADTAIEQDDSNDSTQSEE